MFELERAQALDIANRLYGAMRKLALSTADEKLRTQHGDNGAAGVYILRSFELVLKAGLDEGADLEELIHRHEQMVDIMRKILTGGEGKGVLLDMARRDAIDAMAKCRDDLVLQPVA